MDEEDENLVRRSISEPKGYQEPTLSAMRANSIDEGDQEFMKYKNPMTGTSQNQVSMLGSYSNNNMLASRDCT